MADLAPIVKAFIPSDEDLHALRKLPPRFRRWWKVQLRALWEPATHDETRRFLINAAGLTAADTTRLLDLKARAGARWLAHFDIDKPHTYDRALSELWTKALSDGRTKVETIERVIACIQAGRRNAEETFRGPNAPTDGRSWAYVSLDSIRCLPDEMLTKPVIAWFTKRGLMI